MASADIGLIGLAVMGSNLALNIAEKGYTVAVNNRTASKIDEFMQTAREQNLADKVIPEADHFFQSGLAHISRAIAGWLGVETR